MKRKKFTRSAATSIAGNIVVPWLALNARPSDISKLNHFAQELDFALRVKFPSGTLGDIMRGAEPEIRQDAALLLLGKFFHRNSELATATAAADIPEIANQLARSMAEALNICYFRIRRCRVKETIRQVELLSDDPRLPSMEAANRRHLWQLPFALRHLLALKLLQISVESKQTTKASAKVVAAILDGKMTQAQMARKLGVSRSAVSQTVHSVTKNLRKIANDIELL
jgi:DNA-binding CsgD family transcriptional regulator